MLTGSFALFGGVAYQYFVEGREKRKMKKLFGQYVSPDVYAHLVADPSLARLGGQRREMSVLFSDIRGFTTVSEHGQPEEIVQPAERVLHPHGGRSCSATRGRSTSSSATW